MRLLKLAWRFTRRDLASGEVRVLLAALMLAVAGVTAVAALTDRAERALAMEANRLLGGDAVLRADQPIGEGPRALAAELGLQVAETLGFPSMIRAGEALRLSDIRALSEGYPLRGEFLLIDAQGREFKAEGIPARGRCGSPAPAPRPCRCARRRHPQDRQQRAAPLGAGRTGARRRARLLQRRAESLNQPRRP
jgi:putative ABC transport system permease protein